MERGFWIGMAVFGGLLLAASLSPASRPRQRARFLSDTLLGFTLLLVGLANVFPLPRAVLIAVSLLGVAAAAGALFLALATVLQRESRFRLGNEEAAAVSDGLPGRRPGRSWFGGQTRPSPAGRGRPRPGGQTHPRPGGQIRPRRRQP